MEERALDLLFILWTHVCFLGETSAVFIPKYVKEYIMFMWHHCLLWVSLLSSSLMDIVNA